MMLSLDNVVLSYGGVHAVDHVSLQVERGERVALIGPNGAGKSSLLAVLGGQARPGAGRITLEGRDVSRLAPHRRAHLGVARSFQIASLFPGLSVGEQASLALRVPNRFGWVRGHSSAHLWDSVVELLEEWGIAQDTWEREPGELSYGQQRALELALALARKPKMLLLDEPNVGLTTSENAALVERIRHLDRDMIVILVAHDMDVVFGVADRVIVMQRGQIVVDGEPDAVRTDATVAEIYFGSAEVAP